MVPEYLVTLIQWHFKQKKEFKPFFEISIKLYDVWIEINSFLLKPNIESSHQSDLKAM